MNTPEIFRPSIITTMTKHGRILIFMGEKFERGNQQAKETLEALGSVGLRCEFTGTPGAGGTYCLEVSNGAY